MFKIIMKLSVVCFLCFIVGSSSSFLSRHHRSANSGELAYFLPGNEVERQCFKEGISPEEIESAEDCEWKIGSITIAESQLENNKKKSKFPQSGEQKCSLIDKPIYSLNWTCIYIIYKGDEEIEKRRPYQILKATEMNPPMIEINGTSSSDDLVEVKDGSLIFLKCSYTGDAVPLPLLKFSSDMPLIDDTASNTEVIVKATIKKKDNGKVITCSGIQDIENTQPKMANITLNVLFAPTSETSEASEFNGNDQLSLSFKFEANPEPSIKLWQFAKKSDMDSKVNVEEEPRYIVQDMKKEDEFYVASLQVSDATNEDLFNTCFYLTVENSIGQKTFSHCPDDGGDSVGIIAGILVGVGVLLAALFSGYIYYRKKMRASYMRASTK